ncbi:unnamed protein product, partial [Phaeothamnion confervicola]
MAARFAARLSPSLSIHALIEEQKRELLLLKNTCGEEQEVAHDAEGYAPSSTAGPADRRASSPGRKISGDMLGFGALETSGQCRGGQNGFGGPTARTAGNTSVAAPYSADELAQKGESAALIGQLERELSSTVFALRAERESKMASEHLLADARDAARHHQHAADRNCRRLEAANRSLSEEIRQLRASREERIMPAPAPAEAAAAAARAAMASEMAATRSAQDAERERARERDKQWMERELAAEKARSDGLADDVAALQAAVRAARREAAPAAGGSKPQAVRLVSSEVAAEALRWRRECDGLRRRLTAAEEARGQLQAAFEAERVRAAALQEKVCKLEGEGDAHRGGGYGMNGFLHHREKAEAATAGAGVAVAEAMAAGAGLNGSGDSPFRKQAEARGATRDAQRRLDAERHLREDAEEQLRVCGHSNGGIRGRDNAAAAAAAATAGA